MATQIAQPEFGQRLRELRAERGLSQRDLAVGVVNQSYISLLESGARVPTLEVVLHLSRVLDVPLGRLAGAVELPVEGGAEPSRGLQLAHDLLTNSAVDHGDLAQAEKRLTEAYRAAQRTGPSTLVLTHGLALERVLELRSDRTARYELLRELVGPAEKAGVPEALVRTRIALSSAARDIGRLTEAFTHIELAGAEIEGTGFQHGGEHVRLLAVHASVLSDAGGGAEVVRIVEKMLAMAFELDSPAITGRAHWVASIALARIGEVDRSLGHLRLAREMLANPSSSLRDWARFSRAAASALMDAEANPAEITAHMLAARAATAASEAVGDPTALASLEVRYALATGEPQRALEAAAEVDEEELTGIERVRFVLAIGRAQRGVGRAADATKTLARAARLAEAANAYRRAAQIWRELSDPAAT